MQQRNSSWEAPLAIVILILVLLLVFSTKMAHVIGADVGVTMKAIVMTLLIPLPLALFLKYKLNVGPLGISTVFAASAWPFWWKVLDNIAEKRPDPTWWDGLSIQWGFEAAFLVFVGILYIRHLQR
jgi:hypothetical protein